MSVWRLLDDRRELLMQRLERILEMERQGEALSRRRNRASARRARLSFAETGLGDTAGEELFTHNQVRWRCESRIGLAVHDTDYFAKITGI